jgi:hypothetical protein
MLSILAAAGVPGKNVLAQQTTAATDLYDDPNANGVAFFSGQNYYFLPQLKQPTAEAADYFKYMKRVSPSADATSGLASLTFSDVVTIWRAAKAIGWNKLTSKALYTYMNTKADGKLQVFMASTLHKVPGLPGMKQPNMFLWRLQNRKAVPLGKWDAFTPCGTPKECGPSK